MSRFHAIDSLDDTLDRTKKLLFRPFKLSLWIKLAVVVLMVESFSLGSFNFGYEKKDFMELPFDIMQYIGIIIALVVILILIGIVTQFLSSVFNFVFIESVLEKKVEIMNGFKRNIRRGFSLFIFKLILLAILIVIIALGVLMALLINTENISAIILLTIMIFGFLAFLGIVLIISLIYLLTVDLVLVIMYLKNKGIINSWIYLKDLIKSNVSQFIIYILVKFFLGIVASILILIVSLIVYLPIIVLIIFIAIFFGSSTDVNPLDMLSTLPTALLILILSVGIAVLFGLSYLITSITLPISVFFRYYSIIFLNRVDPNLSVLKSENNGIKEEGIGENLSIY